MATVPMTLLRPFLDSLTMVRVRSRAPSCSVVAAGLNHEAVDHAVERQAVVVKRASTYFRKFATRDRRLVRIEFDFDRAFGSLQQHALGAPQSPTATRAVLPTAYKRAGRRQPLLEQLSLS